MEGYIELVRNEELRKITMVTMLVTFMVWKAIRSSVVFLLEDLIACPHPEPKNAIF